MLVSRRDDGANRASRARRKSRGSAARDAQLELELEDELQALQGELQALQDEIYDCWAFLEFPLVCDLDMGEVPPVGCYWDDATSADY
ncbi:MAG: hypothetical protein WDZ74_00455 [Candidatus Paceibacterota bacterium]